MIGDALQKAVDSAIKTHTAVIEKAREFLPEDYTFTDRATTDIMRAALAAYSDAKFTDEELSLAFKLLKKPDSKYSEFGDNSAKSLDYLKGKEI